MALNEETLRALYLSRNDYASLYPVERLLQRGGCRSSALLTSTGGHRSLCCWFDRLADCSEVSKVVLVVIGML